MVGVHVNKIWQRSPEGFWNIPNSRPLKTEQFLPLLMYKSNYERGFPTRFLEVKSADSIKKK
jgi:hypothetical protein